MAVYNLPKLNRRHQLDATQAGLWVAPPAGLNGLASDLAIERTELRPDELKSIPDAWAQVQLAVQAFFQPGHEASESVRAQWRGLLATIALQPLHSENYSVRVDWYDLPHTISAPHFQRMLRALLPTALQPEASDETASIGIVQFVPSGRDAVPIAMLSPDMLVAPSRQAGTIRSGLPWMSKGVADPVGAEAAMRPASWDILANYLDQLARAGGGGADQVALRQEIETFAGECRSRLSGAMPTPKSVPGFKGRAFQMLAETWDAVRREGESECLLRSAVNAGRPLQGVILADPALTATLRRTANAIKVWGACSLADAQDDKTFQRIREDAAKKGYAILRPDDLFTPKLVRLTGDVSIAGHPKALQDALVPISPFALLLSTPLAVEATQSGDSCEVMLDLVLASGETHVVRKEFDNAATVERQAPDDLAMWPNFSTPSWPWNFLRYQYNRNQDELRARFALSVELLAWDIEAGSGLKEQAQRAREWTSNDPTPVDERMLKGDVGTLRTADDKPIFQRVRFLNPGGARGSDETRGVVGEQQCVAHGIDAIFFSIPVEKGTEAAGCILPQFVERGGQNESATVAIDFGTSNTIAYFARDAQPAQRVRFESRVLFPITMARKMEELAPNYADFFPLWSFETPMPTVLKKRETRGQKSRELDTWLTNFEEAEKARQIPGMSHLVFFIPKIEHDLSSVLIGFINNGMLRFEIKWEKGAPAKAIVKFYLRQLMIMIAAELVAQGSEVRRLGWRMSYPRAFTDGQERSFNELTRELAAELFRTAGGEADAPAVTLRTEGEAAAAYFMHDEEQARKGLSPVVLMLDIGGGTTDIAIRYDETLVWQGSAKLAGADFFRNYLANNPEVVEDIDADAVRSFEQGRGDAGERGLRIRQLVDLVVAKPEFEQAFAGAYALHLDEDDWTGLSQAATVTLGGLIYYCGIVLRRLSADGVIPADQLDLLTVFLGGRGSTFFRRLAQGGDRSPLTSICRLAAADPGAAQIDPRFSELPKQEVARGLLLLDGAAGNAPTLRETLPLGLGVKVGTTKRSVTIEPDQPLESLPAGGTVENLDMAEFASFLAGLKETTGLVIDMSSPKARTAIEMVARNRLAVDLRAIEPGEDPAKTFASLEPPFITALRGLVNLMASAPAERSTLGIRTR